MIQQLQEAFNETLQTMYDLPEEYLHQPVRTRVRPRWISAGSARAQHPS